MVPVHHACPPGGLVMGVCVDPWMQQCPAPSQITHTHCEFATMPQPPKRRRLNGARRRTHVRDVPQNLRWLHLTAGHISNRQTMHNCTSWAILAATHSTMITAIGLCAQNAGLGSGALNAMVASAALVGSFHIAMARLLTDWDHLLHDIPPEHDTVTAMFASPKHPRIDNLSDPVAMTMTGFNHGQLKRLYEAFDLEGYITALGKELVLLPTGTYNLNGCPAATFFIWRKYFCSR